MHVMKSSEANDVSVWNASFIFDQTLSTESRELKAQSISSYVYRVYQRHRFRHRHQGIFVELNKKINRNQKYTQYMQTVHDIRHIICDMRYAIHRTPYMSQVIYVLTTKVTAESKTETEKTCKIYTPNQ